ncbi:unnamed protein product [Lathyrus sativus]|nr:unnamed protein product [Lathyrus sativus]
MKQKVRVMEPFTRDHRGSLEVFNPSSSENNNENPNPNPNPNPSNSWNTWTGSRAIETPPTRDSTISDEVPAATSWMALKETTPPPKSGESGSVAEQRAAEWGLVLKTDSETGKPQVGVRGSGSGGGSRRDSNNSVRSSGESSDDGREGGRGIPRVSEDLRDALSAFQQTFVVSDATKPDYPILYASAGFFNMTGYTSKEVIGRNCRFMQGADTDPNDVAKIREALAAGTSYCGRLLNYKKDGTTFWNLLTIAPIKDEHGKILKLIGMQVEVSKHTEGTKEKMLRPNGLPESLIRYDARQKEKANSSVTELVEAVSKRPRSLSESANRLPFIKKPTNGSNSHATQIHKTPSNSKSSRRKSESTLRSFRRKSHSGADNFNSMHPITELPETKNISRRRSFMGFMRKSLSNNERFNDEQVIDGDSSEDEDDRPDSFDDKNITQKREKRKGLDLATTLERIEKNFVITDPRLPDNPIIFASDSFLELTEYSREEILGRNCRFLQGPETDPATVKKIRYAIDNQTEVTVQLINYTKTGKKFWNLFHLQPMRDQKGEVQYFIGVQLDGSQHVEPLHNRIKEDTAKEGETLVKKTAENVDDALRELPDANMKPEDLWTNHSKVVHPKPHRREDAAWRAIQKIMESGEQIGLKHFKPIKPLGSGDTGSVHLVELCGTDHQFAMKAMDKGVMLNRNKVHRACTEREILDMLDHPFLPALYASFQTKTHICLITDYCPGGELFMLLDRQPAKVLKEDAVRFYATEVVVALEYLHCQGIIYRDLKPENVLLQSTGHVSLIDFDLSCLTSCKPQLLVPCTNDKKKGQYGPIFMAEPMRASNSFVGTEEYIAPEIITGSGHTSAVDWWALGILLYEMFYGYTPFRGKNRQRTFANILHKDLKFPKSKQVSLSAKQLIYYLLQRDPTSRLGSKGGANDVKNHSFFKGINWALVRCTKPPVLDAPLFDTNKEEKEKEKDDKYVDNGQEDMSVF